MLTFRDRPPLALRYRSSTALILLAVFVGGESDFKAYLSKDRLTSDLTVLVDTAAFSIAAPIIPFRLEELGYNDVGDKVGWIIACFGAGLIAATPIAVYVGCAIRFCSSWLRKLTLVRESYSSKISNRQLPLLAGILSMAGGA